jgi:hypothetical protein
MGQKIELRMLEITEKLQREHVKNWRNTIRWRNGYMYRNIKIKVVGRATEISVNVPWAKELDKEMGLFKNKDTLKQRMLKDFRNE